MQSTFLLEKWYLDVVAENGQAAIGYFAIIKWKKFSFTYSGFIQRKNNGEVLLKNSFQNESSPKWNGSQLQWNPKFLKGEWAAIDSSIQVNLLANDVQFIDWNCLMPKGSGKLTFGDDRIEGLGYVEKMILNILPWQLPIKELFWGRFLSKGHSLIWIEWRGPQPKLLIWIDGRLHNNGAISNEGIQTELINLTFLSKFELRSGKIGETIFKGIRKILSVFPAKIFQLNENKWCGVANLTIHGQQVSGTYVHEHVIWQ